MLTGGQLAGLIVAVFWAVLVSFIALTLLKLSRLLAEATKVVHDIGDQAGPLMNDMTKTVRRANEQPGRTDVITWQVAGVTQNVPGLTTVMPSERGGPRGTAAPFPYGGPNAPGNRGGEARGDSRRPQLQARSSGRGRR